MSDSMSEVPQSLPLPAGGATSANQTTEITALNLLHSDNTTLGTLISAASTAANQATEIASLSTIATNSGTQATAANQTTTNTKLDTLHTDLTTLHTDNGTLGGYITGTLKTQRPDLGTPATPAILTSTGDIISANASRKYFYVQNLSVNPLFVRLGTGASSTVFHKVLKGSTVATDGSGGDFVEDQFRGIVSITGTSPSYIAWETT